MTATTASIRPLIAHTKVQVIDLIRTPIAIISTTICPTLAFLFFVLPQSEVTSNAIYSLGVVAQLGVFGVMSAYLFGYGIGVAEERANPWTTYLRTGTIPQTAYDRHYAEDATAVEADSAIATEAEAEATSTDNASTSTSIQLGVGPGVTTMPTNAVTMMSEPMRSLNSETTSRVRCAARLRIGSSVSVVMMLSLDHDMPHSCARYFQLMK